jgi:hypothetical protein
VYPDATSVRDTTVYAVDPANSNHILMSNGTSVMLSNDSGCVWNNVFSVPAEQPSVLDGSVRGGQLSVDFMEQGPGGHAYLVMVGDQTSGDSLVAESSADGRTWTPASGLPLQGLVRSLAVARNTATIAYLVIGHDLYATSDGGMSWDRTATLGFELSDLRVDDLNPYDLWGWTRQALYHFNPDGSVISTLTREESGVATVDVAHVPDVPARVLVFGEDRTVMQSIDGGNKYVSLPMLDAAASSVAHEKSGLPLVTTRDDVFWRPADQGWSRITPDSAESFADAQVITGGALGFVLTEDGLERRSLLDPTNVDVDDLSVATHIPPGFLGPPGPPGVSPANGTVRVTAGHNITITYNVLVPHRFKPVDFYFLADTTGSTTSVIEPLQRSIGEIVKGLRLARIDARVGLGVFRDYPIKPYGDARDYPYRRRRDLGPLDDALMKAITGLDSGGGGDNPEAQLPALFQTATGAGQGVRGAPIYIEPGQQASFRNGVTRVVMLGTDAPFHRSDNDPSYPGPTLAATVDALKQRGIKVVGLAMHPEALPSLKELARATGAVASSDVDCNGDGDSDVHTGGSIVCSINSEGADVTAAVLNAIGAVQEGAKVTTAVSGPGNVVRSFTPASYGSIGLGIDHSLPVAVTYGCEEDQVGRSFPVTVAAAVSGAPLATTNATVLCLPAGPPPPPPPRPAPLPSKPLPNLQQGSPPPPAPVSSANMAPQVQANVQPGMGSQEQQRAQVMMATTDGPAGSGDVELAFSALAAAAMGATALFWSVTNRRRITSEMRLAVTTRGKR